MKATTNIPLALNRIHRLVSQMGYKCEIIDKDELFVFQAYATTDNGDEITININVTVNGENSHIGDGNYLALEVFIPCNVRSEDDELDICYYIMELITQVDLITIQYVPEIQQILMSRVDCIDDQLPDSYIINHILQPSINEFLHIFYLIENTTTDIVPSVLTPPSDKYLN